LICCAGYTKWAAAVIILKDLCGSSVSNAGDSLTSRGALLLALYFE
jgi:hypothetical protein